MSGRAMTGLCLRKHRYACRAEAMREVQRLRAQGWLDIYGCPGCLGFHLGRKDRRRRG